ncbi:MAG: lysophospholipid acyltransferase family protein [Candidatus Margulisiibacteriota bacterium]|nr:lysophospholipid acyltransferase family protein [Candidatus Margulisiibacteriota bacterium]
MTDQDTSAYWRKMLELDSPLPEGLLDRYKSPQRILRPLVSCASGLFFRLWCPETVAGIENVPAKTPYIVAANHSSSLDFSSVAVAMGKKMKDVYPITTKFFYDHWFAGFWIRAAANAVRIDTEEDFLVALRAAARILKAGKAVYMNPEGTRSPDGKLLPFHPGVGVLAVETGAPLVPVYISGTFDTLRYDKLFPKRGPVKVSFAKPIEMGPYIEKKKTTQAYDVYKEVAEELRGRILSLDH